MGVLVIWASPNRDGLTAAAKDGIIKGINSVKLEVQEVHLNKHPLHSCMACNDGWVSCRSEGRCVISDDFQTIYGLMSAVEGIVFVTPVYWHDLAECLKAFLDRLRRCETAFSHKLIGKDCLLAACAGGTGHGVIKCLMSLEETLTHMNMVTVDRLPIIQFNRAYMLPAAQEAGRSFANRITAKRNGGY